MAAVKVTADRLLYHNDRARIRYHVSNSGPKLSLIDWPAFQRELIGSRVLMEIVAVRGASPQGLTINVSEIEIDFIYTGQRTVRVGEIWLDPMFEQGHSFVRGDVYAIQGDFPKSSLPSLVDQAAEDFGHAVDLGLEYIPKAIDKATPSVPTWGKAFLLVLVAAVLVIGLGYAVRSVRA